MFFSFAFRTKVLGFVVLNLLFLALIAGVAWTQLGRIGTTLHEMAETRVPLSNILGRAGAQQFEQTAKLQAALRAAQRTVGQARDDLGLAGRRRDVEAMAPLVEKELREARQIVDAAIRNASSEDARESFASILSRLEEIESLHDAYEQGSSRLLAAAFSADPQADALESEVSSIQEDVIRALDDLSAETKQDTQDASRRAEAFGVTASRAIVLSALIAVAFNLGLGFLLQRIIGTSLGDCSLKLKEVGDQMLASVQQQSASTNETASAVSQTTSTVDQLQQTARHSADKAQTVSETAADSLASTSAARDSAARGIESMRLIREEVEGIAHNILELSERTLQIGEIVQSVAAIAEQSNLLAVNASIEAAKAGDLGKGFSVVASEVKALAAQSRQATEQIRSLLAEIQKASNAAVMVTEQGSKRVAEGARSIEELAGALDQLAGVVQGSADGGHQIAMTATQQLAGVQQIVAAMRNIEQSTKSNAAGAHQLEQAARQVGTVSRQLEAIVTGEAAA